MIKRMHQSLGADHHDQLPKDMDTSSLEKYIDEIAGATLEEIARCKTEKDVWSAVEVGKRFQRCTHRLTVPSRLFPSSTDASQLRLPLPSFHPCLPHFQHYLVQPSPSCLKEDTSRVSRQRPVLRVCSELALVGIITGVLKELVRFSFLTSKHASEWLVKLSNDPTLSSLSMLSTFLKSYSRPYLGLTPPQSKQISAESEPGTLSEATTNTTQGEFLAFLDENEEIVEQSIYDRFKCVCEGYFDNVSKKLVVENKVCSYFDIFNFIF